MYEDFIAERISQLRQEKGVSARDMSLSIGQNKNYINHIENKKTMPSMQAFLYICDYLSITPRDFFDTENANPELVNKFIKVIKILDDSDVKQLLSIAEKLGNKNK